jgi:hypothetical protein
MKSSYVYTIIIDSSVESLRIKEQRAEIYQEYFTKSLYVYKELISV